MKTELLKQIRDDYEIREVDKNLDYTSVNYMLPLDDKHYEVFHVEQYRVLGIFNTYEDAYKFLMKTIRSQWYFHIKGSEQQRSKVVWPSKNK